MIKQITERPIELAASAIELAANLLVNLLHAAILFSREFKQLVTFLNIHSISGKCHRISGELFVSRVCGLFAATAWNSND